MAAGPYSPFLTAGLMFVLLVALMTAPSQAETKNLGDGFKDHGSFSTVAESRGMVCVEDGEGNPVVLVWLFDHRYAYALGVIDALTGDIERITRPTDWDCPFCSLLASNGRYYTYFDGHFIEFDPDQREFTAVIEGPERIAMGMAEDNQGIIWAAIYPDCHVVSYDPETDTFRNYGSVYEHPSTQSPTTIAADDQGWVYVGIRHAAGQIVMLNTDTGQARPVIPKGEVVGGEVRVYPYVNDRVYGYTPSPSGEGEQWFELYQGKATRLEEPPEVERKEIISGYGLRHREWPNGERVRKLDLKEGLLVVENPETGDTRQFEFDTGAEGGAGMAVAALPDNTVVGGTYHPHRFFRYDPGTDEWVRHDCYPQCPQWNTLTVTDQQVYAGCYGGGVLLEWDPTNPWIPTEKDNPQSNPRWLAEGYPEIYRPYAVMAYPNDRTVILAGKPARGRVGGGLLFYDKKTESAHLHTHQELIPWQSTMTMLPLPEGRLLAGTTPLPSIGGVRKTEGDAELYILDVASRKIEWHAPLIDGAERYDDLHMGPDGKVFGIVDRTRFFVFDTNQRKIVHQVDLEEDFGRAVSNQGARIFVQVPDGRIFMLFQRGIARLDPTTYELTMVADAPGSLGNGGAYADGRLYFCGGAGNAHLWSWEVPPAQ